MGDIVKHKVSGMDIKPPKKGAFQIPVDENFPKMHCLSVFNGRRGSGKSIISLNCAIERFIQGSTVAFFTIEMRYKEVHDRLLSIISEVPFLDIYKNKLTDNQKIQIAEHKCETFYKRSDFIRDKLNN